MKPKLIRNLDDNLFNRARADALMKGENIGVWLEDAIRTKLWLRDNPAIQNTINRAMEKEKR